MSDRTMVKKFSLHDETAYAHLPPKKRFDPLPLLSVIMIIVGVYFVYEGFRNSTSGHTPYAIWGLSFLFATSAFTIFFFLRSKEKNALRILKANTQEAYLHEERQARGDISLFEDWEVRGVWREWNDDLDRFCYETEDSATSDYEHFLYNAKQLALEEVAILAKRNPHTTIEEWHDFLESQMEQSQREMAEEEQPKDIALGFKNLFDGVTILRGELRSFYIM